MMTATLAPLQIDVSQFGGANQHISVIQTNMARGLPEFVPSLVQHDGTMICVGSGPSLPTFIEEIKAERAKGRPICAVKGAHDFLCDHGVEPDLFVSVEPRDRRGNLKRKNDTTVYLLASRVATEVFDHLKDCKIVVWHAYGTSEEMRAYKGMGTMATGGGSTSGLRAIALCYLMGFRNFVLYGYDSCNAPDNTTKRFDGSQTGVTHPPIWVGSKGPFICNMAMAAQANEFQTCMYSLFPDIHLEAKGDGLIAAILEERKKAGKRV
jgi:uncharacterized Rossmann fold enzyme